VALYEQAIAKDSSFALAWSSLSMLHGRMFWFGNVDPTPARRERALAALEAAQRLAPNAPETHIALGSFAYRCDNNWRAALAEYALAEPSLPNDAQLLNLMAVAHRRLGQWPEARSRAERSVALNPRDASAVNMLVETVLTLRHYDEARALATRALETFPGDDSLREYLSLAQFALTNDRAARARDLAGLNPLGDNADGRKGAYLAALLAGDLVAADRALAAVRAETFVGLNGAIVEPVTLRRAGVAFLRGQGEAAEKFADEAIAFYRARNWSRRQQALAVLGIAEAEAYAGRADAAVRAARWSNTGTLMPTSPSSASGRWCRFTPCSAATKTRSRCCARSSPRRNRRRRRTFAATRCSRDSGTTRASSRF
jgi:tetratricopeptide (TPR) repeat protein